MEKAPNVAAVVGRFGWEDIGSWDALARVREIDPEGNCSVGPVILLDSRHNIIYNELSREGADAAPAIVLHGVENMIVVRTDKALLITPRSHVQRVKEFVRHLRETGRDDLL